MTVLWIVLIWSLVQQMRIKYTVEHSDHPDFAPFREAMMSDHWQEEIKGMVDDRIDKNQ